MNLTKLVPYILLGLVLGSCAFKKAAVNNLETFISYRLGNQLHLYYAQKSELSKSLQKWIVSSEQKSIIASAQTVLDEFDWKTSDLKASTLKLNGLYRQIAMNFNTLLAQQIALLDESQREKFFKTMNEGNKRLEKEESMQAGIERLLEFCFDEITDEQNQLVQKFYTETPQVNTARLTKRLESQKRIKEVFNDNSIADKSMAIKEALDQAVNRPLNEEQLERNLQFFAAFTQTLTPEQLEYFSAKKKDALEIMTLVLEREE